MEIERIRNFAIIAHIDHGKSTLADCFIRRCDGSVSRHASQQILDTMDIERERGITIKAQAVTLTYRPQTESHHSSPYCLNIIDTPGHVDFSYEVDRSLSACEGALLLIDATQGVQAQSIANCCAAIDNGLEVLPVLNKIDLPGIDTEEIRQQIEDLIGIDASQACLVSAKTSTGIEELLSSIIAKIPNPAGSVHAQLKALVIDSWFDTYVGVVLLVRLYEGEMRRADSIRTVACDHVRKIEEIGIFTPLRKTRERLSAGEIGYVITGLKDIRRYRVGDTLIHAQQENVTPLPGFKSIQPKVFAGIYPVDADHFPLLQDTLQKLALNDPSLTFTMVSANALGLGYRCGFLGTLHMEVIIERLEREYNLTLISTAPSVTYKIHLHEGDILYINNPKDLPIATHIQKTEEPFIHATILAKEKYIGNIMELCAKRRGVHVNANFTEKHAVLEYFLPLNEVIFHFFDELKSVSRGYASFDYTLAGYRETKLARLDILLNGNRVEALSALVFQPNASKIGRNWVKKLCEIVPRQMFDVAVQAAVGSKIIARETIKGMRKNVTAKCYGGDITRKRKLLEKQKAGKKRMKRVGKILLPREAFLSILHTGEGKIYAAFNKNKK